MTDTCRNCGVRIVKAKYLWLHQPDGTSFLNGAYEYCHTTVAEPTDDGVSRKAAE